MVSIGYRSRLTVDQGKVYWREVGQGPALVLLHGGWSDGREWQALVSELSQSYRCYIPDLPGFGDSMLWSDQPVAVTTLVESFIQYLESLNLKRVSIVGHGLGAWVAASYALRFPYAVHRLVLVEPEGVSTPDQKWMCRWGRRLSVHTSLWAGLLETVAPLGGLSGPLSRIKTLLEMRRQIIASPMSGKLMYARSMKEMSQDFLDDDLHKLFVPTLILGRTSADSRQKVVAERYAALCYTAEVALLPSEADEAQGQILLHRIQSFMDVDMPYQKATRAEQKRLPAAERPQVDVAVALAVAAMDASLADVSTVEATPVEAAPAEEVSPTKPATPDELIPDSSPLQPVVPMQPRTARPVSVSTSPAAAPAAAMLQAVSQLPQ